jgi:hypothetical protein
MTYPRVFKMNNTTGAINETGIFYPSRAQEKQELLALPGHLTSPQMFSERSAAPFLVFSNVLWTILFCYHFILSIASLRFTASDYFFVIFSLFFLSKQRKFRLIRTMPYTLLEIDTDIYVGHITFTYVEFVHMCFFLNVTHTWHCMSPTFKSLFILIPKHSQ